MKLFGKNELEWIKVATREVNVAAHQLSFEAASAKTRFVIMKAALLKFLLFVILFQSRVKCIEPAVISNVNAFEVFTPKSMIRFFEFNDSGWNISQDCIQNMYTYLDGLQKDTRWAYKCEFNKRKFGRAEVN